MSNKIQVRRGTAAQLAAITPDSGEPGWTTDTKRLHVGDGSTAGGIALAKQSDLSSYLPLAGGVLGSDPGGSELLRVGGGVRASSGFTVGHEALDVYRESVTFTPTLKGASTAGSHTYSIQQGYYNRIGNLLFIQIQIEISSKDGAMSGLLSIGGLPVASVNRSNFYQTIPIGQVGQLAYGDRIMGRIDPNSTDILLLKHTSGTANNAAVMTDADVGSTPTIFIAGFYEV